MRLADDLFALLPISCTYEIFAVFEVLCVEQSRMKTIEAQAGKRAGV